MHVRHVNRVGLGWDGMKHLVQELFEEFAKVSDGQRFDVTHVPEFL